MGGYITSKASEANGYADRIVSAIANLNIGSLYGADDDNTLAESGVYNTHNSIKETLATLQQALQSDAGNIRTAAEAVDQADFEAAKAWVEQLPVNDTARAWGNEFMEKSGIGSHLADKARSDEGEGKR